MRHQTTLHTLQSTAAKEKLAVYHCDVMTALLNGKMNEVIDMKQSTREQKWLKLIFICIESD